MENTDNYPYVLVIGHTASGKSSLINWIARKLDKVTVDLSEVKISGSSGTKATKDYLIKGLKLKFIDTQSFDSTLSRDTNSTCKSLAKYLSTKRDPMFLKAVIYCHHITDPKFRDLNSYLNDVLDVLDCKLAMSNLIIALCSAGDLIDNFKEERFEYFKNQLPRQKIILWDNLKGIEGQLESLKKAIDQYKEIEIGYIHKINELKEKEEKKITAKNTKEVYIIGGKEEIEPSTASTTFEDKRYADRIRYVPSPNFFYNKGYQETKKYVYNFPYIHMAINDEENKTEVHINALHQKDIILEPTHKILEEEKKVIFIVKFTITGEKPCGILDISIHRRSKKVVLLGHENEELVVKEVAKPIQEHQRIEANKNLKTRLYNDSKAKLAEKMIKYYVKLNDEGIIK